MTLTGFRPGSLEFLLVWNQVSPAYLELCNNESYLISKGLFSIAMVAEAH